MLRKSVADVGLHKSSFQEAQTSIHRGQLQIITEHDQLYPQEVHQKGGLERNLNLLGRILLSGVNPHTAAHICGNGKSSQRISLRVNPTHRCANKTELQHGSTHDPHKGQSCSIWVR